MDLCQRTVRLDFREDFTGGVTEAVIDAVAESLKLDAPIGNQADQRGTVLGVDSDIVTE